MRNKEDEETTYKEREIILWDDLPWVAALLQPWANICCAFSAQKKAASVSEGRFEFASMFRRLIYGLSTGGVAVGFFSRCGACSTRTVLLKTR